MNLEASSSIGQRDDRQLDERITESATNNAKGHMRLARAPRLGRS